MFNPKLSVKILNEALKDVDFCLNNAKKENSQAWKRNYIRSVFVLIEVHLQWLQSHLKAVSKIDHIVTSKKTKIKLTEKRQQKLEDGSIKQTTNFLGTAEKTTFLFDLLNFANFVFESVEKSSKEWDDFLLAIRIRNRITHPKSFRDMHISKNELEVVFSSYNWFQSTFAKFMDKGSIQLSKQVIAMEKTYKRMKDNEKTI